MAITPKIGNIKSTAGTINHFTNAVQNNILGSNEVLSKSPTSFLNLLLDQIGSMNSANFYEMLAIKQEAVKSTAKTRRSLVRYLNSEEIVGILGTPSSFVFNIGFPISDIITNGIKSNSGTLRKVSINKNTIISMLDKPPFTLDYHIDIFARYIGCGDTEDPDNYTYYAKLRNDLSTLQFNISNPFMKGFIQIVDGVKHFMMKIPTRQYTRLIKEYESLNLSEIQYEYTLAYTDNLYGFEIHYKGRNDTNYRVLKGQPDGIMNVDGYNFSLNDRALSNRSITFKFHRDPSKFSPERGSSMTIFLYTTKGTAGNFFIPNWNESLPSINGIEFLQDRAIPEEDAIFNMYPAITIGGPSATGGVDEMSLDNLRDYVIKKSDSKNITLAELETIASQYGLRINKERSDILAIYFKVVGFIEYDGIQILTIPGTVNIDYGKSVMVTPKQFFNINDKDLFSKPSTIEPIEDYVTYYNDNTRNNRNYFFPYFLSITHENKYIKSKVFDMSSDVTVPTIFEYYNEDSPSEVGINLVNIYRNPLSVNYSDSYFITFNIQVNDLIIGNEIDDFDSNSRIYVVIKDPDSLTSFSVLANKVTTSLLPNKYVNVVAEIVTDNTFNTDGFIKLLNSVEEFPKSSYLDKGEYFCPGTVDVEIIVALAGTPQSMDMRFVNSLSNQDKLNGFDGVSAAYVVKGVNLFNDITTTVKPIVDMKIKELDYERYTADDFIAPTAEMFEVYTDTVYMMNPDGSNTKELLKIVKDGILTEFEVNKIAHRRGEIKRNVDGTAKFKDDVAIGKVKLDEDGNPIQKTDLNVYYQVSDLPLVDRIHYGDGYKVVMNAFKSLIEKIVSFSSFSPTGSSMKLGVFNTVKGSYYYYDVSSKERKDLDSLALSLKIGVKLENNDIDRTLVTQVIKDKIVTYIRNASTMNTISLVEMLDNIKDSTIGIKYFELYKVNDIDYGKCTTIHHDRTIEDDGVLTIKNYVDTTNINDIKNGAIKFRPDIDITII